MGVCAMQHVGRFDSKMVGLVLEMNDTGVVWKSLQMFGKSTSP